MAEERKPGISEGIRTGVGMLMAFKEALEETVEEALQRGDLSQERARELMNDAGTRLQQVVEETRERFDMVPRREFDELKREVEELRSRLDRMGSNPTPPAPLLEPQRPADGGPSFPVD